MNVNWKTGYALKACPWHGDPIQFFDVTPTGSLSFVLDADGRHVNFYYDSASFSEVNRPYIGGTVFTGNSVLSVQPAALRVDYIGAANNAADEVYNRMYVALEDTVGNIGVYENPDSGAALVTIWTQWHSSLKDINAAGTPNPVNLAAVSAFHLGFGEYCLFVNDQGLGGDGMFDNIRLLRGCDWPGALSSDFDGSCYVDLDDLALMAQVWLMDCPPSNPCIGTKVPVCTPPNPCPQFIEYYPIVDLNGDDIIDFRDFAILGLEWKKIILWP